MNLLRKVVQVEDETQGTVKLIKSVKREDEFALDTRSTRTARVQKGP
jgi:von Willebrand factor type A C-terminal domain